MQETDPFDEILKENISTITAVEIEKNENKIQAIGLLDNAVDFFKRAMETIDSNPKESIINFSTAVELILKFPLMLEHWSLIVSGKPNRKEFLKGNFQSTTFKETCDLLEGVFDAKVDKKTISILDTVRAHRNTMVHYFHHNLREINSAKELTVEQALAWFQLNRYLKNNSKKLRIEAYQNRLDDLEKQLVKYSKYAEQKFESIKPRIEGLTAKGDLFEECTNCDQKALHVSKGKVFLSCVCLVCNNIESRLEVVCPRCRTDQILYKPGYFECDKCHYEVYGDREIYEFLDESRPNCDPSDNRPDATPANCSVCEEENCVCLHKGVYLCIHCWTESENIYRCEYCGEPTNCDIENSHFNGCMFCEGYMSYVMSKDRD